MQTSHFKCLAAILCLSAELNKWWLLIKSKPNSSSSRLFEFSEMPSSPALNLMDWTRKEETNLIDGWKSRWIHVTFLHDDMLSSKGTLLDRQLSISTAAYKHIHCSSNGSVVSFVKWLLYKMKDYNRKDKEKKRNQNETTGCRGRTFYAALHCGDVVDDAQVRLRWHSL